MLDKLVRMVPFHQLEKGSHYELYLLPGGLYYDAIALPVCKF